MRDPGIINLAASSFLLTVGVSIYWLARPDRFRRHLFLGRAFEFWILRWMTFAIIWGLVLGKADSRVILVSNDVNSIIDIAFIIAFWKGDSFKDDHINRMNLLFLLGLLVAWGLGTYPFAGKALIWSIPSMTVSIVTELSLGFVTVRRVGIKALPL